MSGRRKILNSDVSFKSIDTASKRFIYIPQKGFVYEKKITTDFGTGIANNKVKEKKKMEGIK